MIFINKMKNFKIYKTPMFLPTLENDKKKKSAILLMTPNYQSSKKILDNPLFINKLRYASYYIEKDISYYINSKNIKEVNNNADSYVESSNELDYYNNLLEMNHAQRSKLKDSDFGLPSKRKYPLDTPDRVRSAIKFFNYCSENEEEELANNIINAIKKFNISVSVGKKNRLSKYYTGSNNEVFMEYQEIIPINTPDNPILSVSAVIMDNKGRILLENHVKNNAYTLPGGKVDEGEDIECAIKRELKEELGINVKELSPTHSNLFCCEYPNNSGEWYYFKDYNFTILNYDGIVENKEPDKCKDLLWLKKDDIPTSGINMSKLLISYIGTENRNLTYNSLDTEDSICIKPWHFTFEGSFEDCKILSKICTGNLYIDILKYVGIDICKLNDIPITHIRIGNEELSYVEEGKDGCKKIVVQVFPFSIDFDDKLSKLENLYRYGDYIISNIIEATVGSIYPSTRNTAIPMMFSHNYLKFDDYYTKTYRAVHKETNGQVWRLLGIGDVESIVKIAHKYDIPIHIEDWDNRETTSITSAKTRIFTKGDLEEYGKNIDITKYYDSISESVDDKIEESNINTEHFLKEMGNVFNTGDKVILFQEDAKSDAQLKRILYNNRMKKRQEVILLYDQVKKDFPFIKYAFPELSKYQKKNLFVDLYFYNNVFFENNTWTLNKGMNLYLDFMKRLIHNPNIDNAGYEKKTLFIPITDWDTNHNATIWNYRSSLNPLSIIYYMMNNNMESKLVETFGNMNIIFVGTNNYFRINFSEIDKKEIKKLATKFKLFLVKICKNEEFDSSDIDTSYDNTDTPEVIKAKLADKIETSKGIDITPQLAEISKNKKKDVEEKDDTAKNRKKKKEVKEKNKNDDSSISKATLNQTDNPQNKEAEDKVKILAKAVDFAGDNCNSEDDAMDELDTEEIKRILIDLDSVGDDKVNISAGRASRISDLDKKLLSSSVKGKSVKDILEEDTSKSAKNMELDIATPNEEWKSLSFVNFDKNYNIDKDIISCFRFFEGVSRPISIRNIDVKDNSTSEDRVELYTVEMEDYRGKRFTIKLDIPVMKGNRFLLRGNSKSIQTQFFNMPIIKTDFDTCQIVSNYMKIFVRKFGDTAGKSLPFVSRFIKAANKYTGNKIKFELGDNTKICAKYQLPIDYVDLASVFSKIETDNSIIYFNQDEIRSKYNIEEELGIPCMYDKREKSIKYISTSNNSPFIYDLFVLFISNEDKDFSDLIYSSNSTSICSYSRASIMNSQIPLVVICAYHEGLRKTLEKANIRYEIRSTLSKEVRRDIGKDWIKFKDGYVIFDSTYESSLLLNGLKTCPTELFEIANIDNRDMYLEFLDNFGGRIKADGLENFYDCLVDPMTKEVLEFYHFPTDYVSILIYANNLLADNKFIKHTDISSRRLRRYELIAVYTFKVLADTYSSYANQLKHGRDAAEFSVKQSAVIDKFLTDTISSDDSCINALRDVETTNSITSKGPAGMNSDRAYSLDKRTYDDSMLNVVGMSTGFAANVGITRQATIDANVDIESGRGFIKNINGNTDKMNSSKSLTITEALTPFGSTRDDPIRTAMTFIQTAKHMVRTEESDPLLVTNGSDEAMPYITTDKFAFKAKKDGKVEELTEEYMLVSYTDGTKDYINLTETIEKNSDGGYYVPLKLDKSEKIKAGSRFKENQILAYDKYSFSNSLGESENLAYNIGKLAKVAVINTDEGFEDSGVITESMAEKLATRINLKFDIVLDKDSDIFKMVTIGQHVECGDDLLIWQAPFDDEDANSLMKVLSSDEVSELGKRKLKSDVTGTVTGIKIFRTVELDEMSDSLKKIVKNYEKPLIELEKKLKSNNLDTSQVPAHYLLPATGKLKKAQNSVMIEFYVEYLDTVGIGDKVVYFSANKATEKNIIPKGKEPYTEFRPNEPVDAFVSEVSIDKRMVTSTLIYGSLQKLMIELDRSIKDLLGIPYDDSVI